jgi:UDP-N-acetylglucosamine 2-epimerase (non-hydrolysing)
MAPKLAIPVVVGTRPEAIKLTPLILALRGNEHFHPVVVSTGQHHRMVAEVFGLADIATDVDLWIGDAHAPLNGRVATVLSRFEDFCREWFNAEGKAFATQEEIVSGRFPPAILVHGDTSSAMAAALGAFHLRIPVVHVEAGLRAGGLNLTPFPEELNRRLISKIACFHCAPTATNQENLVRENIPFHLTLRTGNTGIDALYWASGLELPFSDERIAALYDGDRRLIVVTAHRRENWEHGLAGVAEGVRLVAAAHSELTVIVPLHPNPLVRERLGAPLEGVENVLLTEPLAYAEFARLLKRAYLVITDSGGIQEEAPSLGKPVLVARESTERHEGVEAGTLSLVGTDPGVIADEAERLLTDEAAYRRMAEAQNPYGDGRASERIVAALEQLIFGGPEPASFGSSYDRGAVLDAAGRQERLAAEPVPPSERGTPPQPLPEEQHPLWPS